MKLYFSMIYPYITQNIIIRGEVSTNKLKHVQISINKLFRLILKVKYNENQNVLVHPLAKTISFNLYKISCTVLVVDKILVKIVKSIVFSDFKI